MNEYSDSFQFLQEHSAEFKERQALSRISNSIVECRWKTEGITAEWREIAGDCASPWFSVSATAQRKPVENRGKRVQVLLDADSLEKAERIGNGNVSDGIRRALACFQTSG
ncbi:MAG: hypothetical protein QM739_19905 [Propionivibrio sp.]